MDHFTEFSLSSDTHGFIDLFRYITTVEQQKLDASVKQKDLSNLEDCMKKEQAFVLRLRGLEQRDTLQRKLLR